MEFVSKAINLVVTLKPALPGNPIMAIPPQPGISVRFENGRALVEDPEHVALMKKSRFCGVDFYPVEDVSNPGSITKKNERDVSQEQIIMSGPDEGKRMGADPSALAKDKFNAAVKEAAQSILKEILPSIVEKVRAEEVAKLQTKADESTTSDVGSDEPVMAAEVKAVKKAKPPVKE